MSVTDDIKARLDIVSYINQYVPLRKAGKYHKANCPFHSENTPSFVVNDEYQSWRCFGACAEGGDIFSFAQKYHGWDFKEALEALGQLAGVEVRERTPAQKQQAERKDVLRGMLKEAATAYVKKMYDPNDTGAQAALDYAREARGLSDETIQAFGVGYAPQGWDKLLNHLLELGYEQDDIIEAGLALKSERSGKVYDRFRHRLMVPIRDRRGRAVGFGGRILDPEDQPKYMNSPQTPVFDKSQLLFGLDVAKDSIRETETAVIVEGYMDVITAHQAGFQNVVAQMGTAMTETQLGLIAPRWAKRVVLALDSDAAGQQATRRSLEVARKALKQDYAGKLEVDMRVMQLPDAKDPDDLIRETPEVWQRLVDEAVTVADFVIGMEMASLPEEPTVQQKEAVARRVMPLLLATENDLIQQDNVQRLAHRLLIPERNLLQIAQEAKQAEKREQERRRNLPPVTETEDEGPPPTVDYGEPPPESEEDAEADADLPPLEFRKAKATPRRTLPPDAHTQVEASVLNGLLHEPAVYYRVNGKLRELATGDIQLSEGPLAPFGTADFRSTGLRGLMEVFQHALQQDEQDVLAYIEEQCEDALTDELALAQRDQLKAVLQDVGRVSKGDLQHVEKRIQRAGMIIDQQSDVIVRAMRLRCKRLIREKDELKLLQDNAYKNESYEEADACADRIDLLARAVHLLEVAQRQVSRLY